MFEVFRATLTSSIIAWALPCLLLSSIQAVAADLLERLPKSQVQNLIHYIVTTYPPNEYFIVGIGASPAALVDAINTIRSQSAVTIPFSGAKAMVRGTVHEQFWSGPGVTPQRRAAVARTALPYEAKIELAQKFQEATEGIANGRKIVVLDLVQEAIALMMFKENVAASFPQLPIEALGLDVQGTFVPPDSSYKIISLYRSPYSEVEQALSHLKMRSGIPRWNPAGEKRDASSRLRNDMGGLGEWFTFIDDLVDSDPRLRALRKHYIEQNQCNAWYRSPLYPENP